MLAWAWELMLAMGMGADAAHAHGANARANAGANAGANACHGHEANAAMEQASAPYPWQGQAHAGMSSMPNAVHVILSSMDMPSISSMPIASFSSHAHSQLQLPCPTQLTEILGLLGPLKPGSAPMPMPASALMPRPAH